MENGSSPRSVLIVGGGAGGLCAAIAAARAGARVVILEKADRVGKKILKTGNGRCNLSNLHVSPEGYNAPDFVSPVLSETPCDALLAFFASLGLWTVADREGRVYPVSDTAASVLDVLRMECARLGVEERCAAEVSAVSPLPGGGFKVSVRGGVTLTAHRVIVSTGGGTALLRPLGIGYVPFSPVLCPLKTDAEGIRGLSGLRIRCRATLLREGRPIHTEAGELLFRDFGVSGILALDLSRHARAGDVLSLDLLPEMRSAEIRERLLRQRELRDGRDIFIGIFHRRLGEAVLRRAAGDGADDLVRAVKDYRLTVEGPGDTAHAQVTRGGAALEGFDPRTLESRRVPGLYCVGEALDIDGRCGGYNLHWAFSSGLAAGRSAAG